MPNKSAGIYVEGQIRDFKTLKVGKKEVLMVAKNGAKFQVFCKEK